MPQWVGMMKLIFMLGIFIFAPFAIAKGINVDWSCPEQSQKTVINIFFNDQGNAIFNPDVFDSSLKSSAAEATSCISIFQKKATDELKSFKEKNCPASKDAVCNATVDYSIGKIQEKLKSSEAIKKNPMIIIDTSSVTRAGGATRVTPTPRDVPVASEASLEARVKSGEINPANLSQSFRHQGRDHKVSDFDNLVGDNIEKVFSSMGRDEAKQYAQNYLVAKAPILNSRKNSPQRSQVVSNLEKMFGYIHGSNAKEELAKVIQCEPLSPPLQAFQEIAAKLQETEKVSKCAELNPGQHKVFKKDRNAHYSTGSYLLKRKQDGNYQAILNVKFTQGAGSVTSQEMLARSKRCLAEASPFMKGPQNQNIELLVFSPEETNSLPSDERPAVNNVSIEGPNFGTNAAAYNEKVDCATITHEILHLMGLCDEYEETRPEYTRFGWNCRVITKAPSIMRDLSVYGKAVGQTLTCNCTTNTCRAVMNSSDDLKKLYTGYSFYEASDYQFRSTYCKEEYISNTTNMSNPGKGALILSDESSALVVETRFVGPYFSSPYYKIHRAKITCRCPAGDQKCIDQKQAAVRNISNDPFRRSCPRESTYSGSEPGLKVNKAVFENDQIKIAVSPEIPSLLQPNHFNKILEGSCPGKSEGYQQCAEFAYKGQPCTVPQVCNDDGFYLGAGK